MACFTLSREYETGRHCGDCMISGPNPFSPRPISVFRQSMAYQWPDDQADNRYWYLLSLTGRVKTLAFRRRLSARARRINFGDGGIPVSRAHCIRNLPAFGMDYEVRATRPARGSGSTGDLLISLPPQVTISRLLQWLKGHGAPPAGRVSAPEEAILGTASVGGKSSS